MLDYIHYVCSRLRTLDSLVNISEVLILSIRQIFEGVNHAVIAHMLASNANSTGNAIFLRVLMAEMPPEEYDDNDEEDVAAHVCCEGNEVTWFICGKEDLRA
jgi:hypothetical protein